MKSHDPAWFCEGRKRGRSIAFRISLAALIDKRGIAVEYAQNIAEYAIWRPCWLLSEANALLR
jgi:hypothetical protein